MRQIQILWSLARRYALPVALQSAGTGATLILTLGLARYAGPEVQAVFAKFRYWTDLCLSVALLGLPQAYVYAINKGHVGRTSLSIFSAVYGVLLFLPVLLAGMFSLDAELLQPIPGVGPIATPLFVAIGVSLLIYQRLERSVRLTTDSEIVFSIVTALPALSLLLFYLAFFRTDSVFRYDLLFAGAAVFSTLVSAGFGFSWRALGRLGFAQVTDAVKDVSKAMPLLMRHSLHSVFQAVILTAQPALMVWIMERLGGDLADVSFLNVAAMTIVLCNLIFQYLTPLLFHRWSKDGTAPRLRGPRNFGIGLSIAVGFVSAGAIPLAPWLLKTGLGEAYLPAAGAVQILALAAAPVVFSRLLSPAVHALGRPDLNTISGFSRLTLAVCLQAGLTLAGVQPLAAAAIGWLAGEWIAAVLTLLWIVRLQPSSAPTQ